MDEFDSNIEIIKLIDELVEAGNAGGLAECLDHHPKLLHKQFYGAGQDGLLGYAASLGNVELCQFFLDRGVDINQPSGTSGTALHKAATRGQLEAVKWLLAHGAWVDGRPENVTTPLMDSITFGHVEIAKYLIGNGADINRLHSRSHQTPLDIAVKWGQAEIEEQLRSLGALQTLEDPDWRSEYGGPILKYINDEFGRVLPVQLTSIIPSTYIAQRLAIVNKGKNKLLFTLGLFAVHQPMLELFIVLPADWNMHDNSSANQVPSELLLRLSDAATNGMRIEEGYMVLPTDEKYHGLAWPEHIAGFQVVDCNWGADREKDKDIPVGDTVNLWTLVPIKRTKAGMSKQSLEKNRDAGWAKLTLNVDQPQG
jgi:hypothetical protein